jgi:hypothetical protein
MRRKILEQYPFLRRELDVVPESIFGLIMGDLIVSVGAEWPRGQRQSSDRRP